ncbi:MAG: class I SAM-dependent methyltransferase [Desulfobacterales bacterium]|nr:class I SAM-dependent methyltransferase [Desulfobacterales bacterium]
MNNLKLGVKKGLMSLICFLSYGKWNFRDAYNIIYEGQTKNNHSKEIFRKAFGDEYPEDVENYSFVTLSDLNNITNHLSLKKGDCFADIACGRGGPSMWIARKNGAVLVGVDISDNAINSANSRTEDFGLNGRAKFKTGNFYETGLGTESCDGAISIDALWHVPDRTKAFDEIWRILKPGGKFVFTSWDGNIPFMPDDHKDSLNESGFKILVYEETKGWKERQLAVYKGILESKDILIEEMGKKYALPLIKEAKTTPPVLEKSKRILVVAEKIVS